MLRGLQKNLGRLTVTPGTSSISVVYLLIYIGVHAFQLVEDCVHPPILLVLALVHCSRCSG